MRFQLCKKYRINKSSYEELSAYKLNMATYIHPAARHSVIYKLVQFYEVQRDYTELKQKLFCFVFFINCPLPGKVGTKEFLTANNKKQLIHSLFFVKKKMYDVNHQKVIKH